VTDYARELEIARAAVLDAGKLVMELYGTDVQVEMKGRNDPVTAADKASNEALVAALSRAFPDDAILAEESGAAGASALDRRRWCIDPLDGTKEFIAKNGEFSVMVGLAVAGRPVLGIVYQPAQDILLEGVVGHGAFVTENGERRAARVTSVASPADMRLVVSRSHRNPIVDAVKQTLGIQAERISGSVGIKIGLLVRQLADLYIHPGRGTKLWDTCGPEAILLAGGGEMTDPEGALIRYDVEDPNVLKGLVASNATAHARVIEALRSTKR
jgi:3'(2'), 5'-bisphosphate nucleotidase